jgi:LppX_LprAFG lipoprotein
MTRSMTLRRSLVALAAPLLLSGLAACGSDETAEPASSGSSSESQETGAVDKAEFADDLKAGLEASTTAQMTMHMDMGGQALHADGQIDYTTAPPQLAMNMESPAAAGQTIELRLVDQVLYMNMGQMTSNKFVSYDLSDAANLPPGMEQLTGTMDPLAAFESFEDGVQSVVFKGDEEVDGEQLGHYEMTLDASKVKQFQELPTQAELPEEITYDVWLDGENRIRKMVMDMAMGAGQVSMEIELSEWDEPVDIAAPADSEIIKTPKLAG